MTVNPNWESSSKDPWRINVFEIRRGYIPCNSLEECDRIFRELHDKTDPVRHEHIDKIIYRSTDRKFGPRTQDHSENRLRYDLD